MFAFMQQCVAKTGTIKSQEQHSILGKTLSQPLEKAQESLQVAAVLSMLGARLGLQALCICCPPDCQGLDSSILLPNKPDVSKMPFLHR